MMGGVLLITLSVSVAFGARPAATLDSPPGESIAEFVHGLIFSPDDPESEPDTGDAGVLGDPEEDPDEDGSHSECVSEIAESDAVGGPNDNHGGAVSEAARETCPHTDDDEDVVEDDDEDVVEDEVVEGEVVVDSHGACVSAAAEDKDASEESDDRNHGAWVSKHARFICWGLEPPDGETADEDAELTSKEERKAERAAARAERKAQQAAAKAAKERRGGHGRGGGRP